MSLLETAVRAQQAGIVTIPITGTAKKPAVRWRGPYAGLTEQQARYYFEHEKYGLAAAMGQRSGGLIMLEIEGRATTKLKTLTDTAREQGRAELWQRVCSGAWEQTPSGGYHWYVRLADTTDFPHNTKLALSSTGEVLAETRGEGGYSIIAPTPGAFHSSGKPWKTIIGDITTAALVTRSEYEALCNIFRSLDETGTKALTVEKVIKVPTCVQGTRPGDDYAAKNDWADILTPLGWTYSHKDQQGVRYWVRPGKTVKDGHSATTNRDGLDNLYIFSSSTGLPTEQPISKLHFYALTHTGGNDTEAAKQLAQQGYGTPTLQPRDPTGLDDWINLKTQNDGTIINTTTGEIIDTYTLTDDGNALRFADKYPNSYRWITDLKTWATWNGHTWDTTADDAPIIEALRQQARNLPADDKANIAYKMKSLSKHAVFNVERLLRAQFATPITTFDADPWLLNTPGGLIDLKTGKITANKPNDYCLRSTTVAPDFTMPTPRWDAFLAQTFTGNPELTTYIQRAVGLALIGQVLEQEFYFLHGTGANGKSVLLNVLRRILGTGTNGYAVSLQSIAFTQGAERRHPADIAALAGARLAITSETEEGDRFSESRVKLLTGADSISARYMGGNFFEFQPSHTIIMISNHEPEVMTGGSAFWRRVKKIPFLNIVPEQDRNPNLENELMEEAPGILAWMLQGTKEYVKDGMCAPEVVKVATERYETEQDTVRMYVQDCCAVGEPNRQGYETLVARFRGEYETWCRRNGLDSVSAKAITQRLKNYGVRSTKGTGGVRFYAGIRIVIEQGETLEDVM
ncbi:phage/plasmid primase, P4 family [Actinotignum urinale]|uniref:phage/plasmid primase, P4 family n=1 Tax=Actinotignum urinale TaxID=190146 RepID=UPI0003B7526C|nr:phage/plasmid primase, P4 family [Actinotignum urinale]MDY5159552.1 phage/plasmid primase, P4 family [Actinotignum urinale]